MGLQANAVAAVNPIEHISIRAELPFSVVVKRLEAETGLFDLADIQRRVTAGEPPQVISAIAAMAGASGFMRFLPAAHGAILRLHGQPADAIRLLIGHPLIAVRMTKRATGTALYAPLSTPFEKFVHVFCAYAASSWQDDRRS